MSAVFRWVTFFAFAFVVLSACADTDNVARQALSGACSLNTDCNEGLVCGFGRCRAQCAVTADCVASVAPGTETRCVRGDVGEINVCLLSDESECKTSADCPLTKVCGVDRECRDGCVNDVDCLQGQKCSYRTCADQNELGPDGQLPVEDAALGVDQTCRRNSDCAAPLTCEDGLCSVQCTTDVDCSAGQRCNPNGVCASIDSPDCAAATCEAEGWNCGVAPNGCGGAIVCGSGLNQGCLQGQSCGGGGRANVCGPGTCTPKTCAMAGRACGVASDGCADTLSCGTCAAGQACGADGQCRCVPAPGACDGKCGSVADSCGNSVSCGGCTAGSVCTDNVCTCTPQVCAPGECGKKPDGCGGVAVCGTQCAAGQVCRSDTSQGGIVNSCSFSCDLKECTAGDCAVLSNGCGDTVSCGACAAGTTCGALQPNKCGCAPKACRAGLDCGVIADGCGSVTSCAECNEPFTCGGGGTPSVCGCTQHTCAELGKDCGYMDDGCGTQIACGSVTCGGGTVCGGGGVPNKCAPPVAPGTSCKDAGGAVVASGCGPNGDSDCCEVVRIPGGVFERKHWTYYVGGANDSSDDDGAPTEITDPAVWRYPAKVSAFALDAHEVTVGRFRQYLAAGPYTRGNPPAEGAGRNANVSQQVAETGWRSAWNKFLPLGAPDLAARTQGQKQMCRRPDAAQSGGECTQADAFTFTAVPADRDGEEVVGVSWVDAFAFCIWDGGRLPTENEWLYAAAGGTRQQAYPWGSAKPGSAEAAALEVLPTAVETQSGYGNNIYDGCGASADHHVRVGSRGRNVFGVSGLYGLGLEWTLDTRNGVTGDYGFYDCSTTDCAWTFEGSGEPQFPGWPEEGGPSAVRHVAHGGASGQYSFSGGWTRLTTSWAPASTTFAMNAGVPRSQPEIVAPSCSSDAGGMTDPVGFRCARDLR